MTNEIMTRTAYLKTLLALEHNSNANNLTISAAKYAEDDDSLFEKEVEQASDKETSKEFIAIRDRGAALDPDCAWGREAKRRAEIAASYGGLEAAIAPCEREARLLKAASPWRIAEEDFRSTYFLNGGRSLETRAGEDIWSAYPLPETVTEAFEEHKYWWRREQQLQYLTRSLKGHRTDVVVRIRWDKIFDLLAFDLQATSLEEILIRCEVYRRTDIGAAETARERIIKDVDAVLLRGCEAEEWPISEGCAADIAKRLRHL